MNQAGEIARLKLGGETLPEAAARHLLSAHGDLLPDLSGLVVLVPNHRAGQDFARALSKLSGLAALIPPRILPLKSWAEDQADAPAEPSSRRLARLHAMLQEQAWLGKVDKWVLADELLKLSDALAASRPGATGKDILASVAHAPSREIALVEAVHAAFNGSPTDPALRYASALDRLAKKATASLYFFMPGPLTPTESRFLQNYAHKAAATQLDLAADTPFATCLHAAWHAEGTPIKARAGVLKKAYPQSPLQSRIKLFPAPHLEAEARAAATWVGEQLQAGRRRIALIALDRLTARRTRALLERMEVLVEDETGWTLSTTAAAAVIDRWLECLANDFPHLELLDLLKSPFLLGELFARQDSVLRLELAMRRHGVAQGRSELWQLAQNDAELAGVTPLLKTLFDAAQAFTMRRAPLAVWLERLLESLGHLQAIALMKQDAAGAQLLERLESLKHELKTDAAAYTFSEWRRWLDWVLESASFIDKRVSSPVVLTSLPNTRGRSFEAAVVLGADAAHLPGTAAPGLFSQSLLAALGLPAAAEHFAQLRDDLFALILQGHSLLTWQAWKDDEPNPPSAFVTLLQTLHKTAWHTDLDSPLAGVPPTQASVLPQPATMPAPAVALEHLPRRYSPSAYQTLLDCPYRFFARHVLGLKELDEADEALDKSDYGNALHQILKRFHDHEPPPERDAALALLAAISAEVFGSLPAYTATAWRARWNKSLPGYIDLWLAHGQQGWRYQSGECDVATRLTVAGVGEIELHGRIDRIDACGHALRVIDYKTSAPAKLKKKAEDPGEDVQLPVYAWLAKAEAAFLPIDSGQPSLISLATDVDTEAIGLRLPRLLEEIVDGAPLPAHGIDAVCQYCEARGLCRKGGWDV